MICKEGKERLRGLACSRAAGPSRRRGAHLPHGCWMRGWSSVRWGRRALYSGRAAALAGTTQKGPPGEDGIHLCIKKPPLNWMCLPRSPRGGQSRPIRPASGPCVPSPNPGRPPFPGPSISGDQVLGEYTRLRWAVHLITSPVPALVSWVCSRSTLSGVPCLSSGELTLGCGPPGRCHLSRIPVRLG